MQILDSSLNIILIMPWLFFFSPLSSDFLVWVLVLVSVWLFCMQISFPSTDFLIQKRTPVSTRLFFFCIFKASCFEFVFYPGDLIPCLVYHPPFFFIFTKHVDYLLQWMFQSCAIWQFFCCSHVFLQLSMSDCLLRFAWSHF